MGVVDILLRLEYIRELGYEGGYWGKVLNKLRIIRSFFVRDFI